MQNAMLFLLLNLTFACLFCMTLPRKVTRLTKHINFGDIQGVKSDWVKMSKNSPYFKRARLSNCECFTLKGHVCHLKTSLNNSIGCPIFRGQKIKKKSPQNECN